MTTTLTTTLRFASLGAMAVLLAGCSMGGLMGGGSRDTAQLQNATATPAAVAQAQTSALPVIATECPPIKVRLGGEAMFYYGGGRTGDAKSLQYQGVIDETSRNCVVSNGQITVNMGVTGRVLLGPAGKQTSVNAPIRFAVERDGQAIFSEKYTIPVAITPPAQSAEFVKVVNSVNIPYLGGENITIWVGFDTRG
ncbi:MULTISPECIES: hypothetical protein [Devosia]|uniref:Lipoprotein n=1 Tax=Devosia equisanguinis TaxID=2490941 RepID=A0A3S4CCJ7_9HYPH|nr:MULTISPECIES: hypothetical protein [Devosia]ODT47542.1 MAG: hypothetical protein ABS74_14890 [Pelagibacterium sp. SCN 63-126]ODU86355.1 MAG: hypothetical protein ABT14_08800 [Pelagibacterium sp. SCN 63-17]OJX42750.1 MAG: hypothetical protein BGO80_14975 [Devosia sp. 63-57]VDS04077.1 hypothetical protein DEVEQU_01208 [Devosia equisanguinis]